ncbi:kinase domain protein [Ceratobasidium sp. AG-Ba]|nr:kinase domain protein [Ceratobasidium sp. AG-Ba]
MAINIPNKLIDLSFFVYGDPEYDVNILSISPHANIRQLIKEIEAADSSFRNRVIKVKRIFKLDKPPSELGNIQLPEDATNLLANQPISKYWPEDLVNDGNVHILVKPSFQEARRSSSPQADTIEEKLRKLSIREYYEQHAGIISLTGAEQKEHQSTINKGPTPSAISKLSTFHQKQRDDKTAMNNGRPRERQGQPLEIYHPVFHDFKTHVQSTSDLNPNDLQTMEFLLSESQDMYPNEDERVSAIGDWLDALLGREISVHKISGCVSNGVIRAPPRMGTKTRRAYLLIMEARNEIGTGDSDPSIQCAESYARYWSDGTLDTIRGTSCCPSFILAIAGPWMCILGAVYLDKIVVHPLTDMMWMGRQVHEIDRLCHLTRTFCALRDGIQNLIQYYESLPTQYEEIPGRFFPYINRFHHPNGDEVLFDYFEVLAELPARPVFRARTRGTPEQLIVVKFVRDYNSTAHHLLAEHGFAPNDSVNFLDCGFRMIVMESISAPDLFTYLKNRPTDYPTSDIQAIRGDISSALSILHAENMVFGDLRAPNVLVVQREQGVGGMLIDFDWCSIHSKGRYPLSLNSAINMWADGVTRGGLMDKKHDDYMLTMLLEENRG